MARVYGKIKSEVWLPSNDYRLLTWRAQWLYQAITSQGSITPAGVLSLQPTKWARFAEDLTLGAVMEALQELVDKRYVLIDHDTEELLVRTFIHHDGGLNNPKMVKSIQAAVPRIESATLRAVAADAMRAALDRQSNANQGADPVEMSPDEKPQVERQSNGDPSPIEREPILPAACSLQLEPNNEQQQPAAATESGRTGPAHATPESAAAAALDLFIQHRVRVVSPHNPAGFERALRASEPTVDRQVKLDRYLANAPDATTEDIAYHVYDMGPLDLWSVGVQPSPPAPTHDPDCPDCAGSGYRTVIEGGNTVEPCPCVLWA